MKYLLRLLTIAACFWTLSFPGRIAAADISGEYRITDAVGPGGGAYTGKLTVTSQGPSYQFQWMLGSGEKYSGPAIMLNGVVGSGFGDGLSGLAVYEIKGKTLKAKWLLPATPKDVGEYTLSGPATLDGKYKFTNGMSGGVTIKPNGKVYDISWDLPSGKVTGFGIKVNDVLVAVSGAAGARYGAVAYHRAGDHVEGVWTTAGETALGTENLVPASAADTTAPVAAASGAGAGFNATGAEVKFGGENYLIQHNVSAPGKPTSELREYLRTGETFDTYVKMMAFRMEDPSGTAPYAFTHFVLDHVKKEYPKAMTNEIAHTDDSSTMEFLIASGTELEYNFWHYFKTPQGLASVQFVLRNKAPFETEDKLKAEHEARIATWISEAKALAPQVVDALGKTAKPGGTTATAKAPAPQAAGKDDGKKDDADNDELVAKIQADLRASGNIAGDFLQLLQASKFEEATALVAEEGFTQMHTTKKDFLAKLQQGQKTDGRLLSFTPDRNKPDFGAEAGGIYFALEADSKYEKTTARETLRFFRFSDGKVKMVGYQRAAKK